VWSDLLARRGVGLRRAIRGSRGHGLASDPPNEPIQRSHLRASLPTGTIRAMPRLHSIAAAFVAAALPPIACTSSGSTATPGGSSDARDAVAEVPDAEHADRAGDTTTIGADAANPDGSVDATTDVPAEHAADAVGIDGATTDVTAEHAADAAGDGATSDGGAPCGDAACGAVRTVVTGGGDSCVIFADGRLKCWGANAYGQLGRGDDDNRGVAPGQMGPNLPSIDVGSGRTVRDVAVGGYHVCALLDTGQVKCWGANLFGALGSGDQMHRGNAANQMGDNMPAVDLGTGRTAVGIVAGNLFNCALLDHGQVKCWGDNAQGELGIPGDTNHRGDNPGEMGDNLRAIDVGAGRTVVAIDAGTAHVCVLLDNAQIKCWGANYYGELGRGGVAAPVSDERAAVSLGTGRTAVAVAAGLGASCALLDNGQVKCWGRNEIGQLGLGDRRNRGDLAADMGDNLPAIDLGAGRSARSIHAATEYACAVLNDGSIKCWGGNAYGQLGIGSTEQRGPLPGQLGDNLPPIDVGGTGALQAFSAGAAHNCALYTGGRLACWGLNSAGQLGLGDTSNRGDNPGELGTTLQTVDVGD
jgi:E3 ubiquitin-protein ligase HERC3